MIAPARLTSTVLHPEVPRSMPRTAMCGRFLCPAADAAVGPSRPFPGERARLEGSGLGWAVGRRPAQCTLGSTLLPFDILTVSGCFSWLWVLVRAALSRLTSFDFLP